MSPPAFSDASPNLRRAALGATGLLVVLTTVGAAFSPWLLVHSPLALILVAPDNRHLLLAAPSLPLGTFVFATVLRRGFALTATYVLAGIYGPAALEWAQQRSPRTAGVIRFIERLFRRVGPPLLVVAPGYSVAAVAGVAGTRLPVFLAASTLGQVIWMVAVHRFGGSLSGVIEPFVAWLSDHLWESTAVCILAVAIWQGISWFRRRGNGGGGPALTV